MDSVTKFSALKKKKILSGPLMPEHANDYVNNQFSNSIKWHVCVPPEGRRMTGSRGREGRGQLAKAVDYCSICDDLSVRQAAFTIL